MYVLLTVEGEVCSIKKEMCCWVATYVLYVSLNLKFNFIFNCRKSTTCTHVFGLFHTLVSLAPAQFQATPSTTDDNHHFQLHYTPTSGKSLGREKRAT